jgi:hypothetical protein
VSTPAALPARKRRKTEVEPIQAMVEGGRARVVM